MQSNLIVSGKALNENRDELTRLMTFCFAQNRYDEIERIRELISQARTRKEQSITGNGHSLAMMAAGQSYSPGAKLQHDYAGLGGVRALKAMDEAIKDDSFASSFQARLKTLQAKLLNAPKQWVEISDKLVGEVPSMVKALMTDEQSTFSLLDKSSE